MSEADAEKWLTELITAAELDARIDSEEGQVVMASGKPSVYQQVVRIPDQPDHARLPALGRARRPGSLFHQDYSVAVTTRSITHALSPIIVPAAPACCRWTRRAT